MFAIKAAPRLKKVTKSSFTSMLIDIIIIAVFVVLRVHPHFFFIIISACRQLSVYDSLEPSGPSMLTNEVPGPKSKQLINEFSKITVNMR